MTKRHTLFSLSILLVLSALVSTRCGSGSGVGGGNEGVSVNLVIQNPDPNASGSAKAIPLSDVSQAKTLTSSDIDTCTLTVSASDISTITHTFSVASGASTVTTSLTVPAGSGRTFALDCSDSSETTNNIAVGYKGSSSADIGQGSNTISLSPQFKNLVTDDSSGVKFMRLNQENSTQTKLTIGLGSVLTDAQMIALRCVIEFDPFARRTSLGVIDANQSTGLTTGSKSGSYILITGGTGRPDAYVYDSSDSKVMKLNPSWMTQDDGNTLISITFGITQLKTHVDNNEAGQYAGACSLTGTNPYDLLPNSGYAEYELDANTSESDVSSLIDNGSFCNTSRSGETCSAGDCPANALCRSLTAVTSGAVVTNLAGPAQGSTVTGDTDGVGSAARFHTPIGACVTPDGSKLFVGDSTRNIIREITISTGAVTTVAGASLSAGATDGIGSAARFSGPRGCTVDPSGTNVYIADFANESIRKMNTSTYAVTTFAGTGSAGSSNGIGTAASFSSPWSVLISNDGDTLYVSETGNALIRAITVPEAVVTTLAGNNGNPGSDNGIGTAASFSSPRFLAIDPTDTYLYVAELGNHLIRKIVIATQLVSTFAGSGVQATTDGTGTDASLNSPQGLVMDPSGTNLYFTEMNPGNTVRKIVIDTQVVTTIAGSGTSDDTNGTGTAADFSFPHQIAISPTGILYISEGGNNKIRQIQ